jgi:hypothetical protein
MIEQLRCHHFHVLMNGKQAAVLSAMDLLAAAAL